MYNSDTICAISTPSGRGGIAVARVSGADAIDIVDRMWRGHALTEVTSHTAHLGTIVDPTTNAPLDQAVATVFRAPRSFTGENIVEISVHGSTYIQQQLITLLCQAGARVAEPGEFTRRAFVNQRLDLAEAEAVADIIASSSRAAHRLAISQLQGHFSAHIDNLRNQLIDLAALLELELDFSEEDVEFADRKRLLNLATSIRATLVQLANTFHSGHAITQGIPVAIIGRPNSGKSSLLNALLCADRAIVSDIPGTTRDTVEDTIDINGITFRFIDTAGIHHTSDPIEQLGIERALQRAANAAIIIWLTTPGETDLQALHNTITEHLSAHTHLVLALNKADLAADAAPILDMQSKAAPAAKHHLAISAKTGMGLDQLRQTIAQLATADLPTDESMIVTNARHHQALLAAAESLTTLIAGMQTLTPDLLAFHLRAAIDQMSAITGAITSDTILHTIFARFCIGK